MNMKLILIAILTTTATSALAGSTYTVDGKTYQDKASAVKAILVAGKAVTVQEHRCVVLSDKLSFKACKKAAKN